MTTRVVHFQFGAVDADRLSNFYREVFGWTVREARLTSVDSGVSGAYRFITAKEAGLSGGVTGVGPKGVVLTVEVDDLAATLERAKRFGGRRLADPEPERMDLEVPGRRVATFAMNGFADPEGNTIQLLMR